MKPKDKKVNVENLFGFVKKTYSFVVGRENLFRLQRKLKFLLVTEDISSNSLKKITEDFEEIPIVQHYTSEEIEKFFNLNKTKVIGFKKSALSDSIFMALKDWRLNG